MVRRKLRGLERKLTGMDIKIKKREQVSKGTENELPAYISYAIVQTAGQIKRYVIKPYNGAGSSLFKAKKQTFYIEDLGKLWLG